jgi:tryptophan synthase alpha chain
MNRIERKFKELRRKGKSAFIAYITAGYPDLAATERLLLEFARRGVDIVELGIPFSDPLADGPLIQAASAHALKKGVSLARVFSLVRRIRAKTQIPVCFMTYYNPVFVTGEERFIRECVGCGVDGVIIPDLPMEEAAGFSRACSRAGIDLISFVSPTTSAGRMKRILRSARGFIYYVSFTGVTGPRQRLPRDLAAHVARVKAATGKPVCVGFGISSVEQVRSLGRVADGVIVGSAIIRKIGGYAGTGGMVAAVAGFVEKLARAANRE